jgi:hypothetical protein
LLLLSMQAGTNLLDLLSMLTVYIRLGVECITSTKWSITPLSSSQSALKIFFP